VHEVEALLFAAHRLILQMTGYLSASNAGVMRLKLRLESEDTKTLDAIVALSVPSRDPKHLINLLRERLSLTTLPGRIEAITLEAMDIAQLAPRNFSFFPDATHAREERTTLVEKLRARLGDDAVCGLSLFPDARPPTPAESARRTALARWPPSPARWARAHRVRLVGRFGCDARLLHRAQYRWRDVLDLPRTHRIERLVPARHILMTACQS